jgi:hypothetical protein
LQVQFNEDLVQLAEIELRLNGWSCEWCVVVLRSLKRSKKVRKETSENGERRTSAPMPTIYQPKKSPRQIVQRYRQRADAESVFDELKNPWHLSGFFSQKAVVSQIPARMLLLAYNQWSLFVRVLIR